MELGLQTAFREITLVFFTTLAPSGAIAFVFMALPLIGGWVAQEMRVSFNKYLCVPLLVSMVGLVASATHLGNPSNALYVFLGVGQSPLSNEVFFAVVFLALGGLYWIYSFTLRQSATVSRVWLIGASIAAIGFVLAICYAYDARTVITWQLPTGPLSVIANALLGAPLIALACFAWIGETSVSKRYCKTLLCVAVTMVVVNAGLYAWQWLCLESIFNSRVGAVDLVPYYWLYWSAFVLLEIAAVAIATVAYRGQKVCIASEAVFSPGVLRRVWERCAVKLTMAAALSLCGIFVMRFVFYMMHMTVGLGV